MDPQQDIGSAADPVAIERRIAPLLTAARRANDPYGVDVLAAVALDAAPEWAAHRSLADAVRRLVVAIRRDRSVRTGAIPPHSIHPDIDPGDRRMALWLTGRAVMLAGWRLAMPPGATPCPLCVVAALAIGEIAPAEQDGLCTRHATTTTRTEAQQ